MTSAATSKVENGAVFRDMLGIIFNPLIRLLWHFLTIFYDNYLETHLGEEVYGLRVNINRALLVNADNST